MALSWLCLACSTGSDLPDSRDILRRIVPPEFRDATYDVCAFGARGDGLTDCRNAINEAIARCSAEGGGRVVVPAGQYLCKGPIVLKSNVNLHLESRSEILFSPDPADYLPAVLTIWEGTELFNYSPLVCARHVSNIALTGQGTLNGRASQGFAKFRPQRSAMQDSLRQMGIDQVPVRERCFGARSILPPSMIQPYGCRNILIEGITILDSPYWVIHPVFCDNVTVRGVTIMSRNLNNDGCDPECTTNVLIEDCLFDVGDDAIAIKAGRDQDGWRFGQPTRNILIRNCEFRSKCNGLCIGSEMSAGVENVRMEHVRISRCLSGIYFKSNLDRGGYIRNVHVSDVVCDTVRTAFIRFETNYQGARRLSPHDVREFPDRTRPGPSIVGVRFLCRRRGRPPHETDCARPRRSGIGSDTLCAEGGRGGLVPRRADQRRAHARASGSDGGIPSEILLTARISRCAASRPMLRFRAGST